MAWAHLKAGEIGQAQDAVSAASCSLEFGPHKDLAPGSDSVAPTGKTVLLGRLLAVRSAIALAMGMPDEAVELSGDAVRKLETVCEIPADPLVLRQHATALRKRGQDVAAVEYGQKAHNEAVRRADLIGNEELRETYMAKMSAQGTPDG